MTSACVSLQCDKRPLYCLWTCTCKQARWCKKASVCNNESLCLCLCMSDCVFAWHMPHPPPHLRDHLCVRDVFQNGPSSIDNHHRGHDSFLWVTPQKALPWQLPSGLHTNTPGQPSRVWREWVEEQTELTALYEYFTKVTYESSAAQGSAQAKQGSFIRCNATTICGL